MYVYGEVIRVERLYDLPRILMITYETLSEKQSDLRKWVGNIFVKFTIHKRTMGEQAVGAHLAPPWPDEFWSIIYESG